MEGRQKKELDRDNHVLIYARIIALCVPKFRSLGMINFTVFSPFYHHSEKICVFHSWLVGVIHAGNRSKIGMVGVHKNCSGITPTYCGFTSKNALMYFIRLSRLKY